MPRVLVTRPALEARQWVEGLKRAGFDAAALPLIEIAAVSDSASVAALQQARQELDGYAALMFVSGNAVAHFFNRKKAETQYPRAETAIKSIANENALVLPWGLRLLAPGPGTAAALLAAGVAQSQIDAPPEDSGQFDSEALWRLVGERDWKGRRVLIVRGQTRSASAEDGGTPGRDWLMRQWEQAGAAVDAVSVYERRAPQLGEAEVAMARQAAADGAVWLFSSSEAVGNLVGQTALLQTGWGKARAIATHPRIAGAVRAAGWGVVVESRPALADIASTLRSIESGDS